MPDPIYKPKGPFPLFLGDLKKSTLGWSGEERFQYIELLDQMWTNGGFIENNDLIIAEAMGLNRARNWREKVEKVRRKLVSYMGDNGFLTHQKLFDILLETAEISRIRSISGRLGGRPKKTISFDKPKAKQKPLPLPLIKEERISNDILRGTDSKKTEDQNLFPEDDPCEKFKVAWNAMAKRCGLPGIEAVTNSRRSHLLARVKEHGMEAVIQAIRKVEQNDWMHGNNDRGWRADADFMLTQSKFTRLIEGGYDRAAAAAAGGPDPYRGVEY